MTFEKVGGRGQHVSHAAFEVDSFDRVCRSGWSVLVTGHLEEVSWYQARDMERVQALLVEPWAPGERNLWLRLRPSFVTGRIVRGDEKDGDEKDGGR